MRQLIQKIILVIFTLSTVILPSVDAAPSLVKLEVKELGNEVVFVIYHQREHTARMVHKNQNVQIQLNIASDYQVLNPGLFKKYASALKTENKRKTITFKITNKDLKFKNVIHGERLEALKFVLTEEKNTPELKQDKKDSLDNISRASNNPDGIIYQDEGKGGHSLEFLVQDPESKVAVFTIGKTLWLAFDKKELFSQLSPNNVFKDLQNVRSENGGVYKIKLDQQYKHVSIKREQKSWKITVSNEELKQNDQIIIPQRLQTQEGFSIAGNFLDDELITIDDQDSGGRVIIIPMDKNIKKMSSDIDAIGFKILKTAHGIAISIFADDISVDKFEDALKVFANSEEDLESSNSANSLLSSLEDYLRVKSLLPTQDSNNEKLKFNAKKTKLIAAATNARDKQEAFIRNMELAKFYFANTMYHESNNAFMYMESAYPDEYSASLEARFLTAVTHTIVKNYDIAQGYYQQLLVYHDIRLFPEIMMWNHYNNYLLGENHDTIALDENLNTSMKYYSDDNYWSLIAAELDLQLIANNLKKVEKIFKEVKIPSEGKYINLLKYYKAHYYRKKGQKNLAKQFFADVAAKLSDPYNSTRAEFELIKLDKENGDISDSDAVKRLEGVRTRWRGDKLEYDILLYLANMYRYTNDSIKAIRTFKYIQDAFGEYVSNFYITSEIAKIFNSIFLPGGSAKAMDDFTAVALFYEFKEFNPIGSVGDEVIISIARRLVKLDLLSQAEELMRHQVKYRLKGAKRVEIADNLAVVLMIDNKPREALFVLDDTDGDNFSFQEHEYRTRLRASAFIDTEKYDKAIEYLKSDNSRDAIIIKKEAYFYNMQWKDYIDITENDFQRYIDVVNHNKKGDELEARQDLLRLAISYYQLREFDKLKEMSSKITQQGLKNTIDLLISNTEEIDYKNLDKSLNINQMRNLLTRYTEQFVTQK